MKKITAQTFSLVYQPVEDRMLLLINKDTADLSAFWITRRLYFSIIFEFDGYLDRLKMKEAASMENENTINVLSSGQNLPEAKKREKTVIPSDQTSPSMQTKLNAMVEKAPLLKSVSISMSVDKQHFNLQLKSEDIMVSSKMGRNDFYAFYRLMKKSMPLKEWGII